MLGTPFGIGTPLSGSNDSIQDLYEDAVDTVMDVLDANDPPLRYQPENIPSAAPSREDNLWDDLLPAAVTAGTAAGVCTLLAEDEEEKKRIWADAAQPASGAATVPFSIPELED